MAKRLKNTNVAPPADVGLIGLAVMGQNLALNMADHGYAVAVYNRTTARMADFIQRCRSEEPSARRILGRTDLNDFVGSIKRPRKIVALVQAGRGTDAVIDSLVPRLDPGDIIIDGGNALWTDTIRREKDLAGKNILFVGSGVSGGELGARFGPSLMPGGNPKAWRSLKPIWTAIAAKVDPVMG